MRIRFLPLILLAALPLRAATFIVAADVTLTNVSKAIVRGSVTGSHTRRAAGGWIETVTTIAVDEVIKGEAGESIDVVELGGVAGGIGYAVAGAAHFTTDERVLLFLDKNSRGEWVPRTMAVGKFGERIAGGERVLERDDVCGWDLDGAPHIEAPRDAGKFADYVRRVVRGERPPVDYFVSTPSRRNLIATATSPAASSYVLQDDGAAGHLGIRWPNFPSSKIFVSHGTQPGAVNGGLTSLQRGLASWTDDGGSNVVYQYGGVTSIATAGFRSGQSDGRNTVQFNDPADEIPGSFSGVNGDVLAIGGAWFDASSTASTHLYNGERFYTIVEADLVVQNGVSGAGLSGNGFDHVLTHELGHTLGFRHSDEPPPGGSRSSSAMMYSSVVFNNDPIGANLQSWDREALAAVYGASTGVPASCNAPAIVSQPQPSSITRGASAVVSVVASGDAPLQYQWYAGAKGNTAQPVPGGTSSTIGVTPLFTTSYWARVSNGCAPPADSNSAAVTVNGCPAVTIDDQTPSLAIIEGKSATLTIAASTGPGQTLSIQWYAGASGVTAAPIANAHSSTLSVSPVTTTTYWARATNSCGAVADTDTITVAVQPCRAPQILVAPAGGNVLENSTATLYVGASGTTPLSIRWYEGARGDTSHPAINGSGATLVTPALIARTSYWARLENACGTTDSEAAVVNIVTSCSAPAIISQPSSATVANGATAVVSVAATGVSLTYQWYEGPLFDFTTPVGGSAPSLVTPPITEPMQFWVRVNSACGVVNSIPATITPLTSSRRRPVGH